MAGVEKLPHELEMSCTETLPTMITIIQQTDPHLSSANSQDCSATRKLTARTDMKSRTMIKKALSRRLYAHRFSSDDGFCLFFRRFLVSNVMCCVGLLGIGLMIIANEINFIVGHNEETVIGWFLKLTITVFTVFLIILVLYYHRLDLSLFALTNCFEDWRHALTGSKLFSILLEMLICAIHPIPNRFPRHWNRSNATVTTVEPTTISLSYITIDVALGLPSRSFSSRCSSLSLHLVFGRLYLVCRFLLSHSRLVHNASSQSLGNLNRVPMGFFFLMKTYLEQWPTRCMIVFCSMVFLIGSWSLRACNYRSTGEHMSIFDAMWLFIVTFTTVGLWISVNALRPEGSFRIC